MKPATLALLLSLMMPFLFTTLACSKDNSKSTQPGPAKALEGIYFVTRYGYNGASFSYFEPFVLLKDGSVRKNLQQPIETLDIAGDKSANPDKWGTWKKDNGTLVVQWTDKTESWKSGNYYISFPAANNETLTGTYTSFFALVNSRRGQHYSFTASGQFSMVRQTGSGNQTVTGTYELKSYGIYFTYSNGQQEAWSFCFYPKKGAKNTDAFLMAEDNFTRE